MGTKLNVSLRTKLIGMVAFVILLLEVGAFLNMENFAVSYKHTLESASESQATLVGDRIAAQFFERYGEVQAFAINPTIQNLDAQKLPALLDQYTVLYGIYDLILVVDKKGKYVASNTKDVAGKDVKIKSLEDKDFSNQIWFRSVMEGHMTEDKAKGFSGTFFEDFIDDTLMKLAFEEIRFGSSFSAPIKDHNGNVVGVITNRAGKRWFENEVIAVAESLRQQGQKDIGLTLGNKEGKLIADVRASEKDKNLQVVSDPKLFLHQDVKEEFGEAAKLAYSGKTGTYELQPKDDPRVDLIGYRYLDNSKWIADIGWTVYSHAAEELVFAEELTAERNFYVILVIGSLISLILAIWFGVSTSKSINAIIKKMAENSSQVSDASTRIASSSTQLSESATEQAAALQETVAAVDEISAMVEKNAEAANRSKDVSQQSREAAEKGRRTVENMMTAIADIDHSNDEISQQMDSSNRELSEITKLISDIGSKTKVINEIVFQTKLLSFNASVEAARAGEYGKGFAVVAEEVGNLAQMSGNAAKEISTLLEESIRKVESIVGETKSRVERLMNTSKDKVRQGSETAKQCNEALDEILVNVQNVDSLVSEIAVASTEQSTGIREISKAVGQMEQVTQQNTSVSQSSSVSAEQLKAQASSLNSIVEELARVVQGQGGRPALSAGGESSAKVLQMPKRTATASVSHSEVLKKVANSDAVPAANDPGFEE